MKEFVPITIAHGDGVGPEIMESVLHILMEAGARVRLESIEVGEKLYIKNYVSGISEDALKSIERTTVLLKGPIIMPIQDDNYRDLSDTLREVMFLDMNITFFTSYPFFNKTHNIDLVIISENNEQDYEKIIRFAFEFAVKNNRHKILCFVEDMTKHFDEIFYKTFNEVAGDYKQIEYEHSDTSKSIISNLSELDVILTTRSYKRTLVNDISKIIKFPILNYSADIGYCYSMFEACYDPKSDITRNGVVNPSCLLQAAIMMLKHIGQNDIASIIQNAWRKAIDNGTHTSDIYNEDISIQKVSNKEFTSEIIQNIRST